MRVDLNVLVLYVSMLVFFFLIESQHISRGISYLWVYVRHLSTHYDMHAIAFNIPKRIVTAGRRENALRNYSFSRSFSLIWIVERFANCQMNSNRRRGLTILTTMVNSDVAYTLRRW